MTEYTSARAHEVLSPLGAYPWHSGGGIELCRVDSPAETYVLVSDEEDPQGRPAWMAGFYKDAEDQGVLVYAYSDQELRGIVKAFLAVPR